MQVVCASNNGVIKICTFEEFDSRGLPSKKQLFRSFGRPNKFQEIDSIAWFDDKDQSTVNIQHHSAIVVAFKNLELQIMNLNSGEITNKFKGPSQRMKEVFTLDKSETK
jgi:hypothetical protein